MSRLCERDQGVRRTALDDDGRFESSKTTRGIKQLSERVTRIEKEQWIPAKRSDFDGLSFRELMRGMAGGQNLRRPSWVVGKALLGLHLPQEPNSNVDFTSLHHDQLIAPEDLYQFHLDHWKGP